MNINLLNLMGNSVIGQAADQQGGGVMGILNMLFPFILIFVIFYLLVILPQKKQQKKHTEMLNALQKGDNILTSAGIYGRIVEVKSKVIKLEIAPKIIITMQKGTIAGKAAEDEKADEKEVKEKEEK